MQIRTPAVAGMFYASEKKELEKSIKECFLHSLGIGQLPPSSSKKKIYGVICPHAGYMYSGPVASHSFFSLSNERPELFVIIGPNHWGIGSNIASMKDCSWETPLGLVEVDSNSAEELTKLAKSVELDFYSHTREHSIEVQIPFLQSMYSDKLKILPISLINQNHEVVEEIGKAIAKIAEKKKIMIIGSSDFTHYEPNDFAYEQDKALIEPILKLDVNEFYRVLFEKNVTACGYGAIATTMIASKEMGATRGELLKYATSGDVSGDKSSVVGYGSIIFT